MLSRNLDIDEFRRIQIYAEARKIPVLKIILRLA